MGKAVRNVKLFSDLYDRFGVNVNDDKIRLFLRERANVPPTEANSLAIEIGKLLKKNLPYMTPARAGGEKKLEPTSAGGKTVIESGSWELLTDSYGALRVVDDLSAEYAIKMLQTFRERLRQATVESPKPTHQATEDDVAKAVVDAMPKKTESS